MVAVCWPPLPFFITCTTRKAIRDKYGIKESPLGDVWVHLVGDPSLFVAPSMVGQQKRLDGILPQCGTLYTSCVCVCEGLPRC